MKLTWFLRPDATMRRAYAIGVLCAMLLVFCVVPAVEALLS